MPEFIARAAHETDLTNWAKMRKQLWPGHSHHDYDLRNCFANPPKDQIAFMGVASAAPDLPVGFIEVSLRHDTITQGKAPMAYIEGWYVEELLRHSGLGKVLVAEAENWAKSQGCHEICSECVINNAQSLSAHQACGFEETHRAIHLKKLL